MAALVIAAGGLSLLRQAGAALCLCCQAASCGGFSRGAGGLWAQGFGSCGAWAQLLHGKGNPPIPGVRPTALCVGKRTLLTSGPPGRPLFTFYSISKCKGNVREENASLLFAAWRNSPVGELGLEFQGLCSPLLVDTGCVTESPGSYNDSISNDA